MIIRYDRTTQLGEDILMTAITAAFGNLGDASKSADNPIGNDNNQDEAKI